MSRLIQDDCGFLGARFAMIVQTFVLLFALVSCDRCYADNPIEKKDAIGTMQQFERMIQSAKWRIMTSAGKISAPYDVKQFEPDKNLGSVTSYVIIEPLTGRYRFDQEMLMPVSMRNDPNQKKTIISSSIIGARLSYSFDGKRERQYKSNTTKAAIPDAKQPGEGAILKPTGDTFKKNGLQNGTAFFPGMFWGERFSSILNSSKDVTIVDNERGLWLIKLMDRQGYQAAVTYDISKGGVISAIDFNTIDGKPFKRYRVQFQKLENGFWAPKTSLLYVLTGSRCEYSTFDNVEINTEINENVFSIHFPPGSKVSDTDRGDRAFIIGSGPEGDLAAVKEFITQEGFIYDFPPATDNFIEGDNRRRNYSTLKKWLPLLAVVSIATVIVLWIGRRYRRRYSKAAICITLISPLAVGFSASVVRAQSNERPLAATHDGKTGISQCGFNVTAFTLEYFKKSCSPKEVFAALEPGEKGVNFSHIKDILSSHGLEAHFRHKVNGPDLEKAIKPGVLAIIPIKIEGTVDEFHYVVIAFHPSKGPLLVDVPRIADKFDPQKVSSVLSNVDGLVLFVQQPKSGSGTLASRIRISPESINLGTLDTQNDKHVTIKLHNEGNTPIFLSGISKPCSCIQTKLYPTLIRPNSSLDCDITIVAHQWPEAVKEQRIVFSFPDGSSHALTIVGTKIAKESSATLSADPPFIRLDATLLKGDKPIDRHLILNHPKLHNGTLRYETDSQWIRIGENPMDKTRLNLHISPQTSLFTDSNEVSGKILVHLDTATPFPATVTNEVPVVLFRRLFFTCTPPVISVNRLSKDSVSMTIVPMPALASKLRILSKSTSHKSISANVAELPNGNIKCDVFVKDDVPIGLHSIKFVVESDRNMQAIASTSIFISDR